MSFCGKLPVNIYQVQKLRNKTMKEFESHLMLHSQTSHCAALAGNARIRVGLIPAYNAAVPPAVTRALNGLQPESQNTVASEDIPSQGPIVSHVAGKKGKGVIAGTCKGAHAFTVQHAEVAKDAGIPRRSWCGRLDARLGHIYR